MSKGCGIEFPHFGARYPDARCCDGYLWDMDSWDESLGGMTIGGDDPCPVCNTEEWLERVMENEEFETKEDALDYVRQLKENKIMTNTILFSLLLAVLLVVLLLYIITKQLREVILFLLRLDDFVTCLRQHKDSIKVKKVEL